MSNAFTYRMPAGIPGQVTRAEQATIEPQAFDPAVPFPAYGVPAKIAANGKVQPIAAGDAVTAIYGLLVRPYPTTGAPVQAAGLGVAVPQVGGICNVLRRGYMMVRLNGTSAAVKDGQVYVRVGNAGSGTPIGGIEASADATASNSLALPGFVFMGPADAQGNTEVAFNI